MVERTSKKENEQEQVTWMEVFNGFLAKVLMCLHAELNDFLELYMRLVFLKVSVSSKLGILVDKTKSKQGFGELLHCISRKNTFLQAHVTKLHILCN
ncbi:MAG: hypothetical protein BGN96_16290 [Bacteroidales bacterium 45-6]|nr:MAG: hypothetical protein BGN96_16290 [Bacteroidales bacterium 45-6]